LPFLPIELKEDALKSGWHYNLDLTYNIVMNSKVKIIWLHDTFCSGDPWLESLIVRGQIDEIFTLSDWHSNYIMNGHRWRGRYFEALKRKVWQTRNGINSYINEVDISKKDPNQFVFSSAVSKGLVPLLENCWSKIKNKIPNAKIKVVGGYYEGAGANNTPDDQELKWRDLKAKYDGKDGIEFTGVVTQQQVAEIVAKSSLMIYPCAFPETFGMCVLEAINYNTPSVTCRFGALEEVATEQTSYLVDYEATNPKFNVDEFVDLVTKAYYNNYLRQQKVYACNEFKPWIGWNSVALQWKQHFCNKLDLPLNIEELKQVRKINRKIVELFHTRFLNSEDVFDTFNETEKQNRIHVITPVWNAELYIDKCINSVAAQLYNNYSMCIIDDMSEDKTVEIARKTINRLPKHLRGRFAILENKVKSSALGNQVYMLTDNVNPDAVIVLLDGDDWLVNNPDIFNYINREYIDGAKFTYGSCHSLVDNIDLIAQPYSKKTLEDKTFKKEQFSWIMPYTHLRTFKKEIFDKIDLNNLKDKDGKYYGAAGDLALFYSLIEKCEPSEIRCIQKILYVYNDASPINDYKVNSEEQKRNVKLILGDEFLEKKEIKDIKIKEIENIQVTLNNEPLLKLEQKDIPKTNIQKKKILIAIPTAKYIESETFKSIYELRKPLNTEVVFQFFYGYNIAQIRNLIAHWAINNKFDYIMWVDSDIILPKLILEKFYSYNYDIISGIYLQRKEEVKIPEIYIPNDHGGSKNILIEQVPINQIFEIVGCGFGAVLTKIDVLKKIGYPQFEYHNAIDSKNAISEDVDFCRKAINKGYKIYADSSMRCEHIGTKKFII